jgi:hypothetical protein
LLEVGFEPPIYSVESIQDSRPTHFMLHDNCIFSHIIISMKYV